MHAFYGHPSVKRNESISNEFNAYVHQPVSIEKTLPTKWIKSDKLLRILYTVMRKNWDKVSQ